MSVRFVPMALTSLVAFASVAGCFPDLSVPSGTDIKCNFNEDCPAAQLCHPSLERCVDEGAIDTTPAGFVALPVVQPPAGGAATTFSLTFEVNEELVADPLVFLDRGDRIAALSAVEADTDRDAQRYTFSYVSDGDEDEGAREIVITLIDLQGNTSTITDAASLFFDFAAPQLASPPRLSANSVGVGDEIALEFVMSEAIPSPPIVEMTGPDGTIAWEQAPGDDAFPLFFRFTFTRGAVLALGDYEARVRAVDAAGNEMNVSAGVITIE